MRLEFSEFKEKYFPLQKISKNTISHNLFEAKTGNIIKTINFTTHSQWEVWKQNFQLEIEHQIHLNEQFPNHILKIIHWCSQIQSIEIIVYIVYECDNTAQSLQQYLDRAMISEQQKMSLAQQILEFSIILEQTEIQHRNIKLKNIILIGSSIYLTDFGSARTHYNVYSKQATIKDEKHKQLETIFYNSPEIIEIVNEENLDFQEQEWRSLFENEQQKNSILQRNDNWALSIVLLQLINFRTSIPDDLQLFYGYDISRFDEEIKLYQKVPQYKIIAEIIKKLSFGRVSGSECLNYLKNQQNIEVQKKQKRTLNLELDGLDKMQLKRSLKFKANIDFLYLSNRQIKNLEQVYEEKQKDQLKKLNSNNIQELQIQKQDPLNVLGGYEKQESSNSLSYQLNSPKNQEKKLLQQNQLQQIFDQSSQNFLNYKLDQYQNSEATQFKKQQNNTNLLQKLNDTNSSRQSPQKEKNQQQQQLIVVQQLQKITDSQQIDESKNQKRQSFTQFEQKQLQLKQVQDTQQFQEQKNNINQKQQVQNEKYKKEQEILQISDDNQGSTMFSRAAQQHQGQEQTQNIIDFSQFESQQKMFQLSQVYKEIQKFNENLQSSRLNEQLQKSSKTENFSQISTQLPQVLEIQKSLNLRLSSKLEKVEKNSNKAQNQQQNFQNQKEKSTLQIITSNDDQIFHQQSILTKSTQVNSVEQHLVQTFEQEDEVKNKKNLNQKQQNLKRKTENLSQILNEVVQNSKQDNFLTKYTNQVTEQIKVSQIISQKIPNEETQQKYQVQNSQNYLQQQVFQNIEKLNQIQENSQKNSLQQVQNTIIQLNQTDRLIPNDEQKQNTIQKKNIQQQISEQFEINYNNQGIQQQVIEQSNLQKIPNNPQQVSQVDQLKLQPIIQEQQQNRKAKNIIDNQIQLNQEQQQLIQIIQNESKQNIRKQSIIQNQFVEIQEQKQKSQITNNKELLNDIKNNIVGNQILQNQELNKYSSIAPNDSEQNSIKEKINQNQIFQNQNQELNYQQQITSNQEQNSIAKNINENEILKNNELKQESQTPPNRERQNSKTNQQIENQIHQNNLQKQQQEIIPKEGNKNQIQAFQIETKISKQNQHDKDIKYMQNDTSIDKLNELSEVQSNDLNESQEGQVMKVDIQSQKNFQQVRMLSSQQLTQYQEILQRLSENSTNQTKQVLLEQKKIVEEIKKQKEKLNSTREQEILSQSGDDFNFQKIPYTENYVSILKDMYLKLDQEEHLQILQHEIEKVYEAENLHNIPIIQDNDNNIFGNHYKGNQYRSIIEQLSQQNEKQKIQTNINPDNIILSQSLIQLNNSGCLKNLDSPDRKQSARLLNQIRQSSVSDEIVPLLMQRFESLQQYQQTKVNQIKSPPNSKSQNYQSEENLNTKLKKLEDFEIWSTNKKIKKFQIWKKTQPAFYEIPQEFMILSQNCKNRMKIENQQYLYGGFTYNKLPHGLGIMMKKPQGAIYEGIFENGKFLYGLVLELNATQKLQKYIGNYHAEKQVKHGHCRLIWFEEIKNTGQFEIEEEHHGPIIFGQLMGQAKRWNLKENWLYIGGFHSSVKSGNGQVFKSDSHNEFQLQFEGEFSNNQFHGMGTFHHNKQLCEIGQYWNGNKVGIHELYKNQVLQKQLTY